MNPCFRYKLLVYLVANVMSKNTGITEELLLDHIQEVEITGLRASQHEVTMLKHIFWSPPCPPSLERPRRVTWGRPCLRPRPLYLRLPFSRRRRPLACGGGGPEKRQLGCSSSPFLTLSSPPPPPPIITISGVDVRPAGWRFRVIVQGTIGNQVAD